MATFDFSAGDGTTLAAYDSRFSGDTTTVGIQSGRLQLLLSSNPTANADWWFENGQPATTQKSEANFVVGAVAAEGVQLRIHGTTSGTGYHIRSNASNTQLVLFRSGAFIDQQAAGLTLGAATALVSIESNGSGQILVKVNGTTRITYNDGAQLTGGFPGGSVLGSGTHNQTAIDNWSDGEPGPTPPVLTSPGRDTITSTGVRLFATSDIGTGTDYGAVSTSASAPTEAQIKVGSGGSIVAVSSGALVSGVNYRTITGLTSSTLYYGYKMAANGSDSNIVATGSFTTAAPGPVISGVSSSSPANGSSLTITGSNFGASQGSGAVVIGGVTQTVTSWGSTSVVVTVARGTNKYGAAIDLVVTNNSGGVSDAYSLVGLAPQAGWSYVDISAPNATTSKRLTSTTLDVTAGDQIAYQNVSGTVACFSDATFSAESAVTSFQYEVWTPTYGWGTTETQTF